MTTRVTLLAGGVGGAKMAEGFASLPDVDLTIIGNVADDEEFHGLWVSPDIDTMLYTLSGRINRDQGWGVADEGRRALDTLAELGAPTWMFLGDRDFGLHIYRTARLKRGDSPSDITAAMAERFGLSPRLVLPTDDRVQTRVRTAEGWLSFQEYFVREQCDPEVLALHYEGLDESRPTKAALEAIHEADLLVIAPSNPLVSIAPILGVTGIAEELKRAEAPIYSVSPIIAGKVVKGPADKMMSSLGLRPEALGIAEYYADLCELLIIDHADAEQAAAIAALGMSTATTDILMRNSSDKTRLATEVMLLFRQRVSGKAA